MRAIVRDLYKRFLAVGRDYPAGLDVVRRRTKVRRGARKCRRSGGGRKEADFVGRDGLDTVGDGRVQRDEHSGVREALRLTL